MGLFESISHLEKSFRPKHQRVITISQFHDPSISPCCQYLMINLVLLLFLRHQLELRENRSCGQRSPKERETIVVRRDYRPRIRRLHGIDPRWSRSASNAMLQQAPVFQRCQKSSCKKKPSLAHGLEERDPDDIFSRQISFHCVVFCVTLLTFVIFCCVLCHSFSYDSLPDFCKNHHYIIVS